MSVNTRAILKSWFETGDNPTQAQFASLIDSFFHLNEDTLTIAKVLNLETALNNRITANEVLTQLLEVVKRTAELVNSNFKDKFVGVCNNETQFEKQGAAYYYYIATETYTDRSFYNLGRIPIFSIVYYNQAGSFEIYKSEIASDIEIKDLFN